jgi:hypothetical protein
MCYRKKRLKIDVAIVAHYLKFKKPSREYNLSLKAFLFEELIFIILMLLL